MGKKRSRYKKAIWFFIQIYLGAFRKRKVDAATGSTCACFRNVFFEVRCGGGFYS